MRIDEILKPPYDYDLECLWLTMLSYNIDRINDIDELCFYTKQARDIFIAIKKTRSTDFKILSMETWIQEDIIIEHVSKFIWSWWEEYIVSQLNKYRNARIIIQWIEKLDIEARWLELDKAKETIEKMKILMKEDEADKTTKEYILDYFDNIEKERKIISSWYKSLDSMIWLEWWQLVVIAWRPSMWKSVVMLNIALRTSVQHNTWFITIEMTVAETLDRTICILWWITSQEIKDRKWNIDMITSYLSSVLDKKLFISEQTYNLTKIEQYIANNKLDVCIIDYLWLIQHWTNRISVKDKLTEITCQLKMIAKKYNCCIILWSQLNREVESRYDKRPQLSDLRDSWSIEQDADIVVMLHREEYYDPDTEKKWIIDLLIRKNRNWPTGSVELATNMSMFKLLDFNNK